MNVRAGVEQLRDDLVMAEYRRPDQRRNLFMCIDVCARRQQSRHNRGVPFLGSFFERFVVACMYVAAGRKQLRDNCVLTELSCDTECTVVLVVHVSAVSQQQRNHRFVAAAGRTLERSEGGEQGLLLRVGRLPTCARRARAAAARR